MSALFSCTRCLTRHPFEELSEGEQLCKECRNNFPVVKCTYCRAEFQQEEKGSTNAICKKCAQNVKQFGKPSACEYCNVIAAFIGNRCQRCANSEKKWGPPQTCEQCKQQCAFDRSEESKKKVDGKILCWLCTMAYKRVLAKTRKRDGNTPVLEKPSSNNSGSGDNSHTSKHNKKHHHHHHHRSNHGSQHLHKSKDKDKKMHGSHKSKSDSEQKSARDTPRSDKTSTELGATAAKKQKIDKSTANGINLTPKPSKETSIDLSSTENMVAMTQLKEEVESLKKQLLQKSQEILERDKKVTELKALQYEVEKETRAKIISMQKQHAESIQVLQVKNRELSRQIAVLSKGGKRSLREERTNSPSV